MRSLAKSLQSLQLVLNLGLVTAMYPGPPGPNPGSNTTSANPFAFEVSSARYNLGNSSGHDRYRHNNHGNHGLLGFTIPPPLGRSSNRSERHNHMNHGQSQNHGPNPNPNEFMTVTGYNRSDSRGHSGHHHGRSSGSGHGTMRRTEEYNHLPNRSSTSGTSRSSSSGSITSNAGHGRSPVRGRSSNNQGNSTVTNQQVMQHNASVNALLNSLSAQQQDNHTTNRRSISNPHQQNQNPHQTHQIQTPHQTQVTQQNHHSQSSPDILSARDVNLSLANLNTETPFGLVSGAMTARQAHRGGTDIMNHSSGGNGSRSLSSRGPGHDRRVTRYNINLTGNENDDQGTIIQAQGEIQTVQSSEHVNDDVLVQDSQNGASALSSSGPPPPPLSLPECIICMDSYNDRDKFPMVLSACGHTFCKRCIENDMRCSGVSDIYKCPKCRKGSHIRRGIQKNFNFLESCNIASELLSKASELEKQNADLKAAHREECETLHSEARHAEHAELRAIQDIKEDFQYERAIMESKNDHLQSQLSEQTQAIADELNQQLMEIETELERNGCSSSLGQPSPSDNIVSSPELSPGDRDALSFNLASGQCPESDGNSSDLNIVPNGPCTLNIERPSSSLSKGSNNGVGSSSSSSNDGGSNLRHSHSGSSSNAAAILESSLASTKYLISSIINGTKSKSKSNAIHQTSLSPSVGVTINTTASSSRSSSLGFQPGSHHRNCPPPTTSNSRSRSASASLTGSHSSVNIEAQSHCQQELINRELQSEMQNLLSELAEKNAAMQSEITAATAAVAVAKEVGKEEVEEMKEKLVTVEEEAERGVRDMKQLEKISEEQRRKISREEEKIRGLLDKNHRHQNDIQTFKRNNDELTQLNYQLSTDSRNRIQQLEQQKTEAENRYRHLITKSETLQRDNEVLLRSNAELNKKDQQHQRKQQNDVRRQTLQEEQKNALKEWEDQLRLRSEQFCEKEQELRSLTHEEKEIASEKLQEVRIKNEQQTSEIMELQNQVELSRQNEENKHKELQIQQKALEIQHMAELAIKQENYSSELSKAKAQAKTAENEKRRLQERLESLQLELISESHTAARNATLRVKDNYCQSSEFKTVKSEIDALKQETEKIASETERVRQKEEAIKIARDELNAERNEFKSDQKKLNRERNAVKSQKEKVAKSQSAIAEVLQQLNQVVNSQDLSLSMTQNLTESSGSLLGYNDSTGSKFHNDTTDKLNLSLSGSSSTDSMSLKSTYGRESLENLRRSVASLDAHQAASTGLGDHDYLRKTANDGGESVRTNTINGLLLVQQTVPSIPSHSEWKSLYLDGEFSTSSLMNNGGSSSANANGSSSSSSSTAQHHHITNSSTNKAATTSGATIPSSSSISKSSFSGLSLSQNLISPQCQQRSTPPPSPMIALVSPLSSNGSPTKRGNGNAVIRSKTIKEPDHKLSSSSTMSVPITSSSQSGPSKRVSRRHSTGSTMSSSAQVEVTPDSRRKSKKETNSKSTTTDFDKEVPEGQVQVQQKKDQPQDRFEIFTPRGPVNICLNSSVKSKTLSERANVTVGSARSAPTLSGPDGGAASSNHGKALSSFNLRLNLNSNSDGTKKSNSLTIDRLSGTTATGKAVSIEQGESAAIVRRDRDHHNLSMKDNTPRQSGNSARFQIQSSAAIFNKGSNSYRDSSGNTHFLGNAIPSKLSENLNGNTDKKIEDHHDHRNGTTNDVSQSLSAPSLGNFSNSKNVDVSSLRLQLPTTRDLSGDPTNLSSNRSSSSTSMSTLGHGSSRYPVAPTSGTRPQSSPASLSGLRNSNSNSNLQNNFTISTRV